MSYYSYNKNRKYKDKLKYRRSGGSIIKIDTNTITRDISALLSDKNCYRTACLETKVGEHLYRLKCDKYTIGFLYVDNKTNIISKYELCYNDISTFFDWANITDIRNLLDWHVGKKLKLD